MPVVGGTHINPFYRQVDPYVVNELNARGNIHGQRVRGASRSATAGTGGGDAARNLNWGYGKKSWCRIYSPTTGIVLGTAGSSVMSTRNGNLTLYSAARNVPRYPLLQSLDVNNEGTMGSLLKGKFTFTIYPRITTNGFVLDNIEDAFFTPGAEVNVNWGWSVTAASAQACTGKFTGIIYNFNWSVNPDLSITADCSIVSAATISTGMSGDVNTGDDPNDTPVTIGTNPLPGPNIVSVIDKDLAGGPGFAATFGLAPMTSTYIGPAGTATQLMEYYAIGLPFQPTEPESTGNIDPAVQRQGSAELASTPPVTPPVPKPFYYTKLLTVVEFINKAIDQLETGTAGPPGAPPPIGPDDVMKRLFRVQVAGNYTAWNDQIRSAFPIDVFFPDDEMGEYGGSSPFTAPAPLRSQATAIVTPGVLNGGNIGIGEILIGTDFIKKTYKEFVAENAANISHKNLTSFFETICKRINYATGDVYQLSPVLFETEDLSGITPQGSRNPTPAILSIEDTNLTNEATATSAVIPFPFGVDISRAIIRNASISCKPPAASAAAAYTAARAERTGTSKPSNSDVKVSPTAGTGAPTPSLQMTDNAASAATDLDAKVANALTDGFNNAWGEQYRGLITKWKKTLVASSPGGGGSANGHWMKKAVYPIDLTLTIDGIMGFKFGDTIQCFAIPARYNQDPWNIVFTVTKISHKIDAGAWTTTLNTKARVSMGG
jgi:hypothetical protein